MQALVELGENTPNIINS
jgi:hypothetical protein